MQEPLVSVQMLTYNHAPYIAKAIESILNQKTHFSFDLVIGEDCSTDGTKEIVYDYAKKYPSIIKVITSEYNVGATKNSYRTKKACLGKYIAWCEGDDFWHSNEKLQLQVNYLENHPECGLVCSDYLTYDVKNKVYVSNTKTIPAKNIVIDPDICDILTGKAKILTCTVVARKSLVENTIMSDPFLYTSNTFKMGDTQLWAEISLQAKIHRIRKSLATHQLLEESATRSKEKIGVLKFLISNSEMCLYLCEKHKLPLHIKEAHEKDWRRRNLHLSCLESDYRLAEIVKTKFPKLSLKEKVWYLAVKYPAIKPVVLLMKKAIG